MKKLLFTIVLAGIIALNAGAQNDTLPNRGFENWQTTATGEDPDGWGSLSNQLGFLPGMITKTTDAHSGTYALKMTSVISDTTIDFLGINVDDIVSGMLVLSLENYSVSDAKYPFTSRPDSLIGFNKGTVNGGGNYLMIEFNVYPNPVNNELNITSSFNENALFNIYDVLGKQIKSIELKSAFTKVSSDELCNGTYFYRIVNKKRRCNKQRQI